MYAVGVDIGGTNIRISLCDESGQLSGFTKLPQRDVLGQNPLDSLSEFILDYIKSRGESIAAVGVTIPGTLDKTKSIVLNAPNVEGLDGLDIKSHLTQRLRLPVFLERDVSAHLAYDIFRFGIDLTGVVVAFYVGTGIANAIMIDGVRLEGSNGVAGEISHMPAWDSEVVCACGNTGCVEPLVGGKYLAGLRQTAFPHVAFEDMFEILRDSPEVDEYIRHLAVPVATEINILDPGKVILGGAVLSMKGFPHEKLEKNIRAYARKPLPERNLEFIRSADEGRNGVIGVALCAINQI